MPHIVLDLPEPKAGLDLALLKQFMDIQHQLMGFLKAQREAAQTMRVDLLSTLHQQQSALTEALEHLATVVQKRPAVSEHSDDLMRVMREMREMMAQKTPSASSESPTPPMVTVKPQVTVQIPPALVQRLDSLEASLLQGLRRSRSRTFGSNF